MSAQLPRCHNYGMSSFGQRPELSITLRHCVDSTPERIIDNMWNRPSGVLRYIRLALHGMLSMLRRAESAGSSQLPGLEYRAHLSSKRQCDSSRRAVVLARVLQSH